jgi:hypothetical protein
MATIATAGTVPNTATAPALAVNKAAAATTYTVRAAATDATTTMDLVNDLRQVLINAGICK